MPAVRGRAARHVGGDADQLTADPVRLEQALSNLVAQRHPPHTVRRHGGSRRTRAAAGVELSVVDSGCGIAPEHLPHVFDRFYKVDEARAAGDGGSGLGLSIVKAIVERHGGTMSADSRPGRTVFRLRLPDHDLVADAPRREQHLRVLRVALDLCAAAG